MKVIETKVCNICTKNKPLSEFYGYVKNSKQKGNYIYYMPYCKECNKKKNAEWRNNNPEKRRESWLNYNKTEIAKERMRENSKNWRENGGMKEWQQNNKDKLKIYNLYRSMNKKHEISKEEWVACKEYFNNSCAYCGMTEIKAKECYGQVLHKEHVINDGENDISNCIPACKSCNSLKHTKDFNEWFNKENEIYSEERYNRIVNWLEKECLMTEVDQRYGKFK